MQNRLKFLALASSLVLAACTNNPYTGEQQASKAATRVRMRGGIGCL